MKIGAVLIGGGYALLPLLENEVVRRRKWATSEEMSDFFALAQLTRFAPDTEFDVDAATRDKVAAFLAKHDAEESTLAALERHGKIIDDATKQIFGEALPLGLRWTATSR